MQTNPTGYPSTLASTATQLTWFGHFEEDNRGWPRRPRRILVSFFVFVLSLTNEQTSWVVPCSRHFVAFFGTTTTAAATTTTTATAAASSSLSSSVQFEQINFGQWCHVLESVQAIFLLICPFANRWHVAMFLFSKNRLFLASFQRFNDNQLLNDELSSSVVRSECQSTLPQPVSLLSFVAIILRWLWAGDG